MHGGKVLGLMAELFYRVATDDTAVGSVDRDTAHTEGILHPSGIVLIRPVRRANVLAFKIYLLSMRRSSLWITAGATLLGLAVVLAAIGVSLFGTYSACESAVPHVECALPDFAGAFGLAGLVALLGVLFLIGGFSKRDRAKRALVGTS
jgi:hypothetical protein